MKTSIKYLVLTAALSLFGCGGGGGDTATNADPATLTGTFIDAKVEGLAYSTATQNGVTNNAGSYSYVAGETVIFKIGDINIGTAIASSLMTPLSFVDEFDVSRSKHINMLRTLQTLDEDGDLSNGISITDGVGIGETLNFDQSATDFGNDVNVQNFIAANSNVALVSEMDAVAHFNDSLVNLTDPTVIIDFTGAVWVEQVRYLNSGSGCTSEWVEMAATYRDFDSSGVTVDAIDESWDTSCVFTGDMTPVTITRTYSELGADLWVACGIDCIYSDLNKAFIGLDGDGRSVETFTSHQPDSGMVFTYKKILDTGEIFESKITKQ